MNLNCFQYKKVIGAHTLEFVGDYLIAYTEKESFVIKLTRKQLEQTKDIITCGRVVVYEK